MTDPIDHNAAYRREDLAQLRRASPHALWTRDTFILEFGEPVHVSDPELVDLAGRTKPIAALTAQASGFSARRISPTGRESVSRSGGATGADSAAAPGWAASISRHDGDAILSCRWRAGFGAGHRGA
jgi:hypothetical protein